MAFYGAMKTILNYQWIPSLLALAFVVACANQPTEHSNRNSGASSSNPSIREEAKAITEADRQSYASIKQAFVATTDAPNLGKMRSFRINQMSPLVAITEKSKNKKPFIIFQLSQMSDQDTLLLKIPSPSLGMQKVGMAVPQLYVLKSEGPIELKPAEYMNRSEFGACLTSYYSYDIKSYAKDGTRFLLVNAADDFDSSMGRVEVTNPNLKLESSVGFCTMIDIYPYDNTIVDVSVK